MAGIPSTSMQGQQPPCMYNDSSNVYIKNEYDQGEIYSVNKLVFSFFWTNHVFAHHVFGFERVSTVTGIFKYFLKIIKSIFAF